MSNSYITSWTIAHQAPLSMWFPRQETRAGCHFLLQGIFLIWESNPHLLHWQEILYHWTTREAPYLGSIQVLRQSSPLVKSISKSSSSLYFHFTTRHEQDMNILALQSCGWCLRFLSCSARTVQAGSQLYFWRLFVLIQTLTSHCQD